MPDYTHVNLKQVEDLAPKFGLAPGLESRFAREALNCEKSGMSYFRIAPGFRTPFGHRHAEQEEIYVVVSGSARIKVEDDEIDLATLDAVRVAPEARRALEGGPDGAEVIAFGAPKPAERDVEMLQGWWQ
jgi:quercetin dioxygenase-like cupin family protein